MEDYKATTRNGHHLIDFYDPDANTLEWAVSIERVE